MIKNNLISFKKLIKLDKFYNKRGSLVFFEFKIFISINNFLKQVNRPTQQIKQDVTKI